MEIKRRKRYTIEYKQDVIRIMEEKEIPIKELARDMGIGVNLLYTWHRNYGKDKAEKPNREENSTEVKKLQRRLKEVEEERDILKKAMAIFTHPTKSGIVS
jgi:transposase